MDLFLAEQMSEANTPDGRAALAARLRGSRFLGEAKGRSNPDCLFLFPHLSLAYRLENWNRLRAPFRPYFFRSFLRGSRVR